LLPASLSFGFAGTGKLTAAPAVAAAEPLQEAVWPVKTTLVEQPSLSVTVNFTW